MMWIPNSNSGKFTFVDSSIIGGHTCNMSWNVKALNWDTLRHASLLRRMSSIKSHAYVPARRERKNQQPLNESHASGLVEHLVLGVVAQAE